LAVQYVETRDWPRSFAIINQEFRDRHVTARNQTRASTPTVGDELSRKEPFEQLLIAIRNIYIWAHDNSDMSPPVHVLHEHTWTYMNTHELQ
jgi:hypothetical protein